MILIDRNEAVCYIMIMQVIFGQAQKELLGDKFTLLELDTFNEVGLEEPVTAYAVMGINEVPLTEMPQVANFVTMHNTMLKEYRARNWSFCKQALEHLKGKWNGQLDSFYEIFESRLNELETASLPDSWNGVVAKPLP